MNTSLESGSAPVESMINLQGADFSALKEHMDAISEIFSSYYAAQGMRDKNLTPVLAFHDKGKLVGAFVGVAQSKQEPESEPDAEILEDMLNAFKVMSVAADNIINTMDRNHELLQEITDEMRSTRQIMSESNGASI